MAWPRRQRSRLSPCPEFRVGEVLDACMFKFFALSWLATVTLAHVTAFSSPAVAFNSSSSSKPGQGSSLNQVGDSNSSKPKGGNISKLKGSVLPAFLTGGAELRAGVLVLSAGQLKELERLFQIRSKAVCNGVDPEATVDNSESSAASSAAAAASSLLEAWESAGQSQGALSSLWQSALINPLEELSLSDDEEQAEPGMLTRLWTSVTSIFWSAPAAAPEKPHNVLLDQFSGIKFVNTTSNVTGFLSREDFIEMMTDLGFQDMDYYVSGIYAGQDCLDWVATQNFVQALVGNTDQSMVSGMLEKAFKTLDEDNDGELKVKWLIQELAFAGLTAEEALDLKNLIDPTNTGRFRYEGFESRLEVGSAAASAAAAAAAAGSSLLQVVDHDGGGAAAVAGQTADDNASAAVAAAAATAAATNVSGAAALGLVARRHWVVDHNGGGAAAAIAGRAADGSALVAVAAAAATAAATNVSGAVAPGLVARRHWVVDPGGSGGAAAAGRAADGGALVASAAAAATAAAANASGAVLGLAAGIGGSSETYSPRWRKAKATYAAGPAAAARLEPSDCPLAGG